MHSRKKTETSSYGLQHRYLEVCIIFDRVDCALTHRRWSGYSNFTLMLTFRILTYFLQMVAALSSFFLAMALYPDVQAAVQAEIDSGHQKATPTVRSFLVAVYRMSHARSSTVEANWTSR